MALIKQYEESTPLWLFNSACFQFGFTFQAHIQHYSLDTDYIIFKKLYREYPNFVRERMEWTEDVIMYNSWPLEFLLKFSLGLYRKYFYIKVLNVGLEPKTYISLHSDKRKEFLLHQKQALRYKMRNIPELRRRVRDK